MWRKLLYSGFLTPKAVAYRDPTAMWLFITGNSLGRMETCLGVLGPKHISNPDFACKLFWRKGAQCYILRLAGRRGIKGNRVYIFNPIQNIARITRSSNLRLAGRRDCPVRNCQLGHHRQHIHRRKRVGLRAEQILHFGVAPHQQFLEKLHHAYERF